MNYIILLKFNFKFTLIRITSIFLHLFIRILNKNFFQNIDILQMFKCLNHNNFAIFAHIFY